MQSPKTKSISSSKSVDELFAAIRTAVSEGTYEMKSVDEASRTMTFSSGKTALSWGNEYVATVTPSGQGSALELVCGTVDGAPRALLDGWKNGKAADKFLQTVRS